MKKEDSLMTRKTKGIWGIAVFLVITLVTAGYLFNGPQQTKRMTVTRHSSEVSGNAPQPEKTGDIPSQPVTLMADRSQPPQLFQPGQDYRVLSRPVKTDARPENVEVVSIFWYGCPHCYALEPKLEQWQKTLPANVEFIRTPGFFGPNLWQTHARLYYTVRNMGLEEQAHTAIFSEIQNHRNQLSDSEQMAEFLNRKFGIEPGAFNQAFKAFSVNNQLQKAFSKLKSYELSGVPAIVIDGRYVVEPGLAGSLGNMPVIADYLIRKVKEDRKG
ncbi:thiol:disulfide interchange protein DsbA/DsbL [Endozoicomonas sp. SCSIO W0465]|uniref:thiol:disulfide interchange protein DsbA/DsbL n=1 Tax=Endozoicomonas sp. SCSIO W0465 TaxID=2918516 RepID=UPI002075F273|nr:thiol:disulfide interchange protein DsbA/DsbL [Endozoicomonas sp. SCSIO W0465]USE36885.1 thiol:disulfide interchange protein DsbA/DsbL [Endozoicomonas sp. SCSIO W0465]